MNRVLFKYVYWDQLYQELARAVPHVIDIMAKRQLNFDPLIVYNIPSVSVDGKPEDTILDLTTDIRCYILSLYWRLHKQEFEFLWEPVNSLEYEMWVNPIPGVKKSFCNIILWKDMIIPAHEFPAERPLLIAKIQRERRQIENILNIKIQAEALVDLYTRYPLDKNLNEITEFKVNIMDNRYSRFSILSKEKISGRVKAGEIKI